MAVIFAISSLHKAPIPEGVSDHQGHALGYAILAVLMFRALAGGSWTGVSWRSGAIAVAFSVVYGLTDEFHQMFVPGRTAAWDDVAADFYGAMIGAALVGILYIISRLWPTKT
jgi:VanZ family protein